MRGEKRGSLGRVLEFCRGVVVSSGRESVQAEEVGFQESLQAELLEALAGPLEILNPNNNCQGGGALTRLRISGVECISGR